MYYDICGIAKWITVFVAIRIRTTSLTTLGWARFRPRSSIPTLNPDLEFCNRFRLTAPRRPTELHSRPPRARCNSCYLRVIILKVINQTFTLVFGHGRRVPISASTANAGNHSPVTRPVTRISEPRVACTPTPTNIQTEATNCVQWHRKGPNIPLSNVSCI